MTKNNKMMGHKPIKLSSKVACVKISLQGQDIMLGRCHIIPISSKKVGLQAHNTTKCTKRPNVLPNV
jgi:hypothetical protein